MADEQREQPTECTPQGYEVPVPKRYEFFGNLKKTAEPDKPNEWGDDTSPPPGDPLAD